MDISKTKYPIISDAWGTMLILFVVSACMTLFLCAVLNAGKSTIAFLSYVISFGSVAAGLLITQSHFNGLKFSELSKKFDWRMLPLCLSFVVGIGYAISFIMYWAPVPELLKPFFENYLSINLMTFVLICIIAPFLEELIFRGIFLRAFLHNYSVPKALFWSSFFFALAHLNPWQLLASFCFGYFIGWLYVKTSSLWLAVAVHAINNLIAFVLSAVYGSDVYSLINSFGIFANILIAVAGLLVAGISVYALKKLMDKAKLKSYIQPLSI